MDKYEYLEHVVTKNYALFVSVAQNIVKNRNDAEEVVQKSLLYVIEKYNADDKLIHNLPAYIIVTINSRALNFIRDKKRIRHCELNDIQDKRETISEDKEMYAGYIYDSMQITGNYDESKKIVDGVIRLVHKENLKVKLIDAESSLINLILIRSKEWKKR